MDDHEMVRKGLIAILEASGGIKVVGEAGTAADAIARIRATRPDVTIMDVRLPDGSGFDVCRAVRDMVPTTRVLLLTTYADYQAQANALLAQASGFFLKTIAAAELVQAVRRIASGDVLLDPGNASMCPEERAYLTLSAQERRVLELIGQGKTNRQIGLDMFLAEKTIKHYVSSVLRKLGLSRRTQAAAYITGLHHARSMAQAEPTIAAV